MPDMLTGIQLNQQSSFTDWATGILPWVNGVLEDVHASLDDDMTLLLARQARYAGYLGTLVELHSKATTYYKGALARAMEHRRKGGTPPSLVARVAEQDCENESLVYNTVHMLSNTISDQLISIASRLKLEGISSRNQQTPF